MLVNGKNLDSWQKQIVLAQYPYRWTTGNRDRARFWAGISGQPTIPLVSDSEWLAKHAFHFLKDGSRLARNRSRHAEMAF